MKFDVDQRTRQRARFSHDLYMLNMFLFALPTVGGVLAYSIVYNPTILYGISLTLLLSIGIVLYVWNKARRMTGHSDEWFIMVHWRLTVRRARLLLIGYVISAVIIALGVLVGSGMADANMKSIMITVFTRVGIVPAVVLVLVTLILEGQAMHLSNNGMIPKSMARRYPVPDGLKVVDPEDS